MQLASITDSMRITRSMKLHNTKLSVYSWSLFLLHNTIGSILWVGETQELDDLHVSSQLRGSCVAPIQTVQTYTS